MAEPQYKLDITVYTPDLERENFVDTIKKLALVSLSPDYYNVIDCSTDDEATRYINSLSADFHDDVLVEAKCSCGQPHHTERWRSSNAKRIYKLAQIIADLEQWDAERRKELNSLGYFI